MPGAVWTWAPPLIFLSVAVLIFITGDNQALFFTLNRLSEWTGTGLWANFTILGDTLVAMTLCLLWVRRRPDVVWAALLAALVTALCIHTLKPLLAMPRPPAVLPLGDFHLIGPHLRHNSFPSGHTATAFTLAGVVVLHLSDAVRRRWGVLLLGAALLVGISRAAVGVHWPLDILVGAACGWLGAAVGTRWARRWRISRAGRIWLGGLVLLAGLILLFSHDTRYEQARLLQSLLAVICLGVFILPPLPGLLRCCGRKTSLYHFRRLALRFLGCLRKLE